MCFGHAGRFCEQKNHKFLIDVFKKIADLENNAVLLLIGAGETFEKVKEQVCEYGLEERVIFLGVRKDIASLYQAMDCFVFPSLFEGLGIVAIEAQCSGLPVVGSDVIPRASLVHDCSSLFKWKVNSQQTIGEILSEIMVCWVCITAILLCLQF